MQTAIARSLRYLLRRYYQPVFYEDLFAISRHVARTAQRPSARLLAERNPYACDRTCVAVCIREVQIRGIENDEVDGRSK